MIRRYFEVNGFYYNKLFRSNHSINAAIFAVATRIIVYTAHIIEQKCHMRPLCFISVCHKL